MPDEVYLVIAPTGGRDDYGALFHEGGHTEHYANTDPGLAFEFRHLGDNSVTESFAFLLEHLTEDRDWLRHQLGVEDPERVAAHARAVKLLFLRRYAAKLAYELELHGAGAALSKMPARYAELVDRGDSRPLAAGELAGRRGRRLLRGLLSAGVGARDPLARPRSRSDSGRAGLPRPRRASGCARCGATGSGSTPHELLAETLGGELDFARDGGRAGRGGR